MKLLKKLPKLSAIARYTLSFLLISLFYVLSFNAAADTEVIYYHNDALGSPVAATDQNGDVIWTEDYAPYGAKLSDDMEAIIEKVGYTGHRYDNDTGLVYAGARMYDPSLGRFMGIDPVGAMAAVNNPVMFNRYAYGNNNPYKYVDPDGEYAELAIEAISLGLGIASFSSNVSDGNYGSAAIDGVGIVVDVVGAIFPIVPGVAGLGIKSLREGGEAVTKGGTETVQRWMSKAELKATQETGLLRGGREGTHYVTDAANSTAKRARQRSALPQTPDVKVTLEVPAGKFSKPSRVEPAFNMPGGGMERTAVGDIPVTIRGVQ